MKRFIDGEIVYLKQLDMVLDSHVVPFEGYFRWRRLIVSTRGVVQRSNVEKQQPQPPLIAVIYNNHEWMCGIEDWNMDTKQYWSQEQDDQKGYNR